MTFTIGRGNDIVRFSFSFDTPGQSTDIQVCYAIEQVAQRIVGKEVESIFADMGAFWEFRKSRLYIGSGFALISSCR
jgi:L-fuconate dehydratase